MPKYYADSRKKHVDTYFCNNIYLFLASIREKEDMQRRHIDKLLINYTYADIDHIFYQSNQDKFSKTQRVWEAFKNYEKNYYKREREIKKEQ